MLLVQIIIGLSWIWIPLLLIFFLTRGKKSKSSDQSQQGSDRDKLWFDYIASFQAVVKTKEEKRLLQTLMEGRTPSELNGSVPSSAAPSLVAWPQQVEQSDQAEQPQAIPNALPAMPAEVYTPSVVKTSNPIDGTLLLLYFGAFLLITSVGLFVAIGGLGGIARTLIVGLTASILYGGGMWLYQANKKLAQAGISFVGTGMMIAPLTGVAWYNLVSNQTHGGIVWAVTSLFCLGLYVHAYKKIRNPFVSYLLIGSFVSSIESAVLTINLPSYAYAWGLLVAAIILIVTSRTNREQSASFHQVSDTSANLLIPLSVLGSIVLIPQFGSMQLAVTLLLSGIYYSLLAYWQTENRPLMSIAAQLSFIAAVANIAYAAGETLASAGVALVVISAVYSVVILLVKTEVMQRYNLHTIASVVSLIGIMLCLGDAWLAVSGLAGAVVLAVIIWQKLRSDEALQVAGILLVSLPFVLGQYALQVDLGSWNQILLSSVGAVLLYGVVVVSSTQQSLKEFYSTSTLLYMLAVALLLIPAGVMGFMGISIIAGAVLASFMMLRYLSTDSVWLVSSSMYVLIPLLYTLFGSGIDDVRFSAALGVALVWNIGVSLLTRQSLARWLVVGCILLAPFAIGGGGLGIHWGSAGYAGGYMLAMASCILARAIARGKLLLSLKVPVASYYTEASQAYVVGYVFAGATSILVSLNDTHSQVITTIILGLISLAVIVISKIERNNGMLSLLPILLQGLIFSGIRPDMDDAAAIGVLAIVSSLFAAMAYVIAEFTSSETEQNKGSSVRLVSVFTAYIGPALVMTQSDPSILLPFSLLVAGLLTFAHNRNGDQKTKELSVGACIASLHWFVYLLGVTNIHAHTHLLAAALACFAYWRITLNDSKVSTEYIKAAFFVVTVPLVLQSLSGESGGSYGLLLIGEQICFMLAGVTFGQRFLLRWGLWTSLAAILFQLRGLGWAFLSLLAIIIIGVAVYRLQKHTPSDSD